MRLIAFSLIACLASLANAAPAAADVRVLTRGKLARFENRGDPAANGGLVVIGRDRELRVLRVPTCPAGTAVQIHAYLQSTLRVAVLSNVTLDCAKWTARAGGFDYDDPSGTVRRIRYRRSGLTMEIRGPGFTPIAGPVGYLEAQLRIGTDVLRARFHNFRRNDARAVVSRTPSTAAALGEAGFWAIMLGDDASEATQRDVLALLRKATRAQPCDGRSHFLLAMLHLYRFGQRVVRFDDVSEDARAELVSAHAAFVIATPLVWDEATQTGDSRVPGFAASAKYTLGLVNGDAALRAEGLADLARAVEVNSFFNVFDYIPVLQALPADDPAFAEGFASFAAYLNDPETLPCVVNQPEICANAGLAPRNVQGALTLFGDLYVKAGDISAARTWYTLANAFPDTPSWKLAAALQERLADIPGRAALYRDEDPSNDPPLIGAGPEACAMCHNR